MWSIGIVDEGSISQAPGVVVPRYVLFYMVLAWAREIIFHLRGLVEVASLGVQYCTYSDRVTCREPPDQQPAGGHHVAAPWAPLADAVGTLLQ